MALHINPLHFDRIRQNPHMGDMAEKLRGQPDAPYDFTNHMGQTMALLRTLNAFTEFRCQTFEVGPKLTESFEHMSISKISADMLLVPYPCFYIHLPHLDTHIIRASDDVMVPLEGIYVYVDGEQWVLSMIAFDSKTGRNTMICWGWPHEDWVESGLEFEPFVRQTYNQFDEEDAQLYITCMTMVAHLLLYLNSDSQQVVIEEPAKFERLQKKIAKVKERRRASLEQQALKATVLRRSHLASDMEARAKVAASTGAQGESGVAYHMVKGHWKRVRFGKGLAKVKTKAIWPYPRGEEPDGNVVPPLRTYKTE